MRLRRIRITNFRKLTGSVDIADLPDGLSVISGDNEAGKSTLLAAIQAALFEKHTIAGQTARDMQPFGSSARPEIQLVFEIGSARYDLEKVFCSKQSATLTTPEGTFPDDEAEEKLQALLGYSPPGRGGAKPEHRGLSGLLWVEQGLSFSRPPVSDDSRSTLLNALEGEVGTVVGGDRGRALLAAIGKRKDAYFTNTGRPRGDLKATEEAVAQLSEELAETEDQLRAHDRQVERLQRLKDDQAKDDAENVLEDARRRHEAALAAWHAVSALQATVERAQERRQAAAVAAQSATGALVRRQQRVAQMAVDRAALKQDLEARTAAEKAMDAARGHYAEADKAVAAARTALDRAVAQMQRVAAREARETKRRELEQLQQKLAAAEKADAAVAEAQKAAEAIRVTPADLERLRGLEHDLRTLQVRADAVATAIDLHPDDGRAASMNDAPLDPREPVRLARPATLRLEGYGALTITPGGEDIGGLAAAIEAAAETLKTGLADAGCDSLDEASRLVERQAELRREIERQTSERDIRTDGNLDALRRTVGDLKTALTAEAAPAADEPAVPRDAAREALEQAQRDLQSAEAEREKRRDGREATGNSLASLRARTGQIEEALASQEAILRREQAEKPDAELERAAAEATAALEDRTAEAKKLAEELAAASPEAAKLTLERTAAVLDGTQARIRETARDIASLSAELRGAGQLGLGEKVKQLEAQLAQAQRRYDDMDGDARALKLLYDTLEEEQRKAKDAFIGPVKERIAPYLRLVFPGAELSLDSDRLSVEGLARADGAAPEPFETLSIGTREQLAVLVRLALADFLLEKGRPVTVILDDTLVYSDDSRFEAMLNALTRAARKLQIIILTCRERDYRQLGAPIFRLRDCLLTGD